MRAHSRDLNASPGIARVMALQPTSSCVALRSVKGPGLTAAAERPGNQPINHRCGAGVADGTIRHDNSGSE